MKWFQHYSDTYFNIKMQEVFEQFGISGYGIFWLSCELVAQQGVEYRIENNKNWLKALSRISGIKEEKLKKILTLLAELDFIDEKELTKNALFIPKMAEYSDDYTNKVRRKSEQDTDTVQTKSGKVALDKIREDKIREDKIREDKRIDTAQNFLMNIPLEVIKEFSDQFNCYEAEIKGKAEDLYNYCLAKGKKYKDYKAFLRNALKKDFGLRRKEPPKIWEIPENKIENKEGLGKYRELKNKFKIGK